MMPAPTAYSLDLIARVRREFLEMPGNRLSLAQAARLLASDRATARRALDTLVSEGFLVRDVDVYQRASVSRQRCA